MIRLAVRQFRDSAWTALAGLISLVAVVLATRPHLTEAAAAARRDCGSDARCPALVSFVLDNTGSRTVAGLLVIVVPALIGAFWGAPLIAREFEAGTHRLVWAQSISRGRWLAVRLAVVGTATVAATTLLSMLVTWWAAPLDDSAAAVYGTFDARDLVPIGYALFALALGVVAGLVTRRTLPAMAITLAGLLTVRIMVTEWVRPLVVAPRVMDRPLDPDTTGYGSGGNILLGIGESRLDPEPPDIPDAWIQSTDIVDAAGTPLTDQVLKASCPTIGQESGGGPARPVTEAVRQEMHDCVVRIGERYHEVVTFQSGDRYWTFQWWELAVFVALAAVLVACAGYRVRRFSGG
ncbi:ABC transporter permease [Actinoplanes sp. M2I2]|uniref:ABC transporter permease n=1 Tax=Actinoplanes sp. M2I2 TaxID=1734444 RepID=UPI0020218756|nr:ABC transporter permease [Actinoplanes sp. M2I2]